MSGSDSANESDFASAESDTEDLLPKEEAKESESLKTSSPVAAGSSSVTKNKDNEEPCIQEPSSEDLAHELKTEPDQLVPSISSTEPPTTDDEKSPSSPQCPPDSSEVPPDPPPNDPSNDTMNTSPETRSPSDDTIAVDPSSSAEKEAPVKAVAPISTREGEVCSKSTTTTTTTVVSSATSTSGGGGGWGGWGGWGGSLWSSVSTIAESAQQKVTSVIASVEDSLGVPSPEEFAQENIKADDETLRLAEEMVEHDVSPVVMEPVREEPHPQQPEDSPSSEPAGDKEAEGVVSEDQEAVSGGMSGFLSSFAAVVQTTGKGLVSGGIDALETIGKKTMEVLSEGDPGLAKKRAMLGMNSPPTLSQLLQEAKARSAEGGEGDTTLETISYSRFFEEYHGVVHLEALELLSKECTAKIHVLLGGFSGGELQSVHKKLEQLSAAFVVEEDQSNLDDDSSQLEEVKELFSSVTLPLKPDKLMKVSTSWRSKVEGLCAEESKDGEGEEGAEEGSESKASKKKSTSEVLYENGLRSLAELTSTAIELFRKMAEVSLLPEVPAGTGPLAQTQKLNRLTVLVSNELDGLASVHSEAIANLDIEGTNSSVTSLYLESSNSGSYVQDAFQLLLPVLKVSSIQELKVQEPSPSVLNRH